MIFFRVKKKIEKIINKPYEELMEVAIDVDSYKLGLSQALKTLNK